MVPDRMRSHHESQTMAFIITAAVLAATSVYFAAFASTPKTAIVIGVFSLLSFAAAMMDAPRSTGVQFDAEGVYDPRLGIGKIYWKEVREFYVAEGEGNRFLCLGVQRPERFIIHADRSQRRRMELNHALGFRRINVDVRHLNLSIQDLHRRIEHRIEAANRAI